MATVNTPEETLKVYSEKTFEGAHKIYNGRVEVTALTGETIVDKDGVLTETTYTVYFVTLIRSGKSDTKLYKTLNGALKSAKTLANDWGYEEI